MLWNNILLQSFNWPVPVHYIPTDKINTSIRIHIWRILKVKIRIHIWRILKVKIRIQQMQILTTFVASLFVNIVKCICSIHCSFLNCYNYYCWRFHRYCANNIFAGWMLFPTKHHKGKIGVKNEPQVT